MGVYAAETWLGVHGRPQTPAPSSQTSSKECRSGAADYFPQSTMKSFSWAIQSPATRNPPVLDTGKDQLCKIPL